jgi:hypothetical protein
MKKFILLFFFTIIFGCKNEPLYNNFDEIIHYQITNEGALKNKDSERFYSIFTSLSGHKLSLKTFEKELIDFGFTKHTFQKEKTEAINDFITNKIYYEGNLTACIPHYRDILILKSKGKTIAILKLCFECAMVEYYGKINSNMKNIEAKDIGENYFNEFDQLYKTLTGKKYKTDFIDDREFLKNSAEKQQ